MIIFLGPKSLLKTQISEKKGNFSSEKKWWPIFSRGIEYDKPQATVYKGPQAILSTTVSFKRPIFFGPKSLLKTQIFEKKCNLSNKNILWPNFSRIVECDKPQGTICKGPQGLPTKTVELIGAFF